MDLHFKVSQELYDRLKAKSVEASTSMGAIARIAISEYLKREENHVK